MRIIAGAWRGRTIEAPRSVTTRPTADRVRQALFDMLTHAPWADPIEECIVLDAFAGSGALGLEALSRGAIRAVFLETDRNALNALRNNVATLEATSRSLILATDTTRPRSPSARQGDCNLVFLDPPYNQGLIQRSLETLKTTGWIAPNAIIVAETAEDEQAPIPSERLLAERRHGAARLSIWREEREAGMASRPA